MGDIPGASRARGELRSGKGRKDPREEAGYSLECRIGTGSQVKRNTQGGNQR